MTHQKSLLLRADFLAHNLIRWSRLAETLITEYCELIFQLIHSFFFIVNAFHVFNVRPWLRFGQNWFAWDYTIIRKIHSYLVSMWLFQFHVKYLDTHFWIAMDLGTETHSCFGPQSAFSFSPFGIPLQGCANYTRSHADPLKKASPIWKILLFHCGS